MQIVFHRGLPSQMPFPENQIFPKKIRKFLVPSIWEHPLLGPDSVLVFETVFFLPCFMSGNIQEFLNASQMTVILTVPTKKSPEWYCSQRFSGKSLKIQYYSRLTQVELSSPFPSCLFPRFPEQRDQKEVVLSRSRQFGNRPTVLVSSHLI